MNNTFSRDAVINIIETIMQHADVVMDVIQNENTDTSSDDLLELAEKHLQVLNVPTSVQSGIELIAQERQEQIEKHGRTIEADVQENNWRQLSEAAALLCLDPKHLHYERELEDNTPFNWEEDAFKKMMGKDYKNRLIIAGALIAAEIDRLNTES